MKVKVGWDLDGVAYSFGGCIEEALRLENRHHVWKSGPNAPFWDFYKDWGWTGSEFKAFCDKWADNGIVFTHGEPRPGFLSTYECVQSLNRYGYDVENIIITDRSFGTTPSVSEKATVEWLSQYEIEYDQLVFSPDKTCVHTDFFIDDKLENYDALVSAGTKAYLLNRPWNKVEGDVRNRINTLSMYYYNIASTLKEGAISPTLV